MRGKLLILPLILLMLRALPFDVEAQINRQKPPLPPMPDASPTPPPVQKKTDGEVIRVETELVTLTSTVADKNGRYRADLQQSDFTVYENGAEQKLEYFNTGDRVPISLGIVFETSGSMEDKIEGVQDAVEHFVKSVSLGDEIFLVGFSDDAEIVQDFIDDKKRSV